MTDFALLEGFLTLKQAGDLLGCTPQALRDLAKKPQFQPYFRLLPTKARRRRWLLVSEQIRHVYQRRPYNRKKDEPAQAA